MSVLVGLVRHGAHDELGRVLSGRASDIGLNTPGEAEAEALGRALVPRAIAAIETSPRLRTRQTAAILGNALDVAPQVAPDWDEVDFGDWAGRSFADLDDDPRWQRWNAARATAPSAGGETMMQAVARAAGRLQALGRAGGGPVLCVSHCDVIRGLVADVLGLGLDHILNFDIDTASVSWLMVDGHGQARLLTLNGRS